MNRDSFKFAMDVSPTNIGNIGRHVFAPDDPLRQLQGVAAKRAMLALQNAISELQDRIERLEQPVAAAPKRDDIDDKDGDVGGKKKEGKK